MHQLRKLNRYFAQSTAVDGGYLVSGSFTFGSGSSLARWVLVAEELPDREGQQWFRAYIVPKEDFDIKTGSWDAMGLRATASVDYTIADKFVPDRRTFESLCVPKTPFVLNQ